MKYIITNSFDGWQYFLTFAKLDKSYFDEDGDWLKDIYKIGDIEIIQSGSVKQGKRIPRIALMMFEDHAKSIYRMDNGEEKKRLSKRLIEWFIEFTEENYDKWEDIK